MKLVDQIHDANESVLRKLQLKITNSSSKDDCNMKWTKTLATCLELLDEFEGRYGHDSSHVLIHHDAQIEILKQIEEKLKNCFILRYDSEEKAPKTKSTLESRGRVELIVRVCCIQLKNCMTFLLNLIAIVPEWQRFWQQEQKRWYLITKIESGPFEWFIPRSQRIQIKERLRALDTMLYVHACKIGQLKQHLIQIPSENLLLFHWINMSFALMESVLDSKSIRTIGPRRGWNLPEETTKDTTSSCIQYTQDIQCHENDPIPASLEILVAKLVHLSQAQKEYKIMFDCALRGCEQPNQLRRKWLHVSIGSICVLGGIFYFHQHRHTLRELKNHVFYAIKDFFMEHMIDPIKAIIEEVVFNKKPEIQDAAALIDTKESLRRMLDQFLIDTNPLMKVEERQKAVEDMDMSVVSLQFEKEIPKAMRNILSGDIVRMLLIQVQFIRKELMMAMGSIDDLVNANQLNMQLMATIPTFLVVGGVYKILEKVSVQIVSLITNKARSNPTVVFREIRDALRDIERLLNRQSKPETINPTKLSRRSKNDFLGERDLGYLLLLLHRLHLLFETHRRLFDRNEQLIIQEDLSDLVDENMNVSQQLATINRMYHTHQFLKVSKVSSRWF